MLFQVAVNGAHFATFPHRISMYNLRFLEVEAAIAINQVSIYQQVRCKTIIMSHNFEMLFVGLPQQLKIFNAI